MPHVSCVQNVNIVCGGAWAKNYTTSTMNNHLQYKHPDEHKTAKLATNMTKLESVPPDADVGWTQPTLAEFTAKRKPNGLFLNFWIRFYLASLMTLRVDTYFEIFDIH